MSHASSGSVAGRRRRSLQLRISGVQSRERGDWCTSIWSATDRSINANGRFAARICSNRPTGAIEGCPLLDGRRAIPTRHCDHRSRCWPRSTPRPYGPLPFSRAPLPRSRTESFRRGESVSRLPASWCRSPRPCWCRSRLRRPSGRCGWRGRHAALGPRRCA